MPEQIYEAIPRIMADMEAVGKNNYNQQQKFKFRGIDDVMNAMNPVLVKHHVFTVPEVLEQTREHRTTTSGGQLNYSLLKMRFSFFAPDGSHVDAITLGEGMDSGDKASNKAMAIAYKYALFQVFCIPTEDMDDPDADTPPESRAPKATAKAEKPKPADPSKTGEKPESKPKASNPAPRPADPPKTGEKPESPLAAFMRAHDLTTEKFAKCRQALIDGGKIEDKPSKDMTPADWSNLLQAIESRLAEAAS